LERRCLSDDTSGERFSSGRGDEVLLVVGAGLDNLGLLVAESLFNFFIFGNEKERPSRGGTGTRRRGVIVRIIGRVSDVGGIIGLVFLLDIG
jgi:hypothetical protein